MAKTNVVDWDSNPRIKKLIVEAYKLHFQAKKPGAKGGSRLHWKKSELELFQKYSLILPHDVLKNNAREIKKWVLDKEISELGHFFSCDVILPKITIR